MDSRGTVLQQHHLCCRQRYASKPWIDEVHTDSKIHFTTSEAVNNTQSAMNSDVWANCGLQQGCDPCSRRPLPAGKQRLIVTVSTDRDYLCSVSRTGTLKQGEHTFPFKFLIPGRSEDWWDEHCVHSSLCLCVLVRHVLACWCLPAVRRGLFSHHSLGLMRVVWNIELISSVSLNQPNLFPKASTLHLTISSHHAALRLSVCSCLPSTQCPLWCGGQEEVVLYWWYTYTGP